MTFADQCQRRRSEESVIFVTFIDDYSRYCVLYLLKKKSEVAAKFTEFVMLAETQAGMRVKKLQSDNGDEYTLDKLAKICAEKEINKNLRHHTIHPSAQ